jgi:solute carrier family 30 (zinc transporter), member 2
VAGSIAIQTDSAHLASDMFGFAVSFIALKMSQRTADQSLTYGWHRAEILGTLISVLTIWVVTALLFIEATKRFFIRTQVLGGTMVIVAIMGLFFNLIQMKILHQGSGHYQMLPEDTESENGINCAPGQDLKESLLLCE